MKLPGFQPPWQPHTLIQKGLQQRLALRRMRYLRVKLQPVQATVPALPIAANGELADCASALKPSGNRVTRSPWLIQTGIAVAFNVLKERHIRRVEQRYIGPGRIPVHRWDLPARPIELVSNCMP
jgi:hypothetical protein